MKKWLVLPMFAIVVMAFVASSHAATLPTKADRPLFKVGDTWAYTKSIGTNIRTFTYTVVSLSPDGGYQAEVQNSGSGGTWKENYDANGNVVKDTASIYSPSRGIFQFPLEAGKLYSPPDYSRKNPKDPSVDFTMHIEIKSVAPEHVVVKAGSFDTLKIEVEVTYQGRSSRGTSAANRVVETYWYAPEVGRWVKRHYNDLGNKGLETWELESFKRA